MGNIRAQQESKSQTASNKAAANKNAAAASGSIPDLNVVVAGNSDAIQDNAVAIQRLEALVEKLQRQNREM